MTVETEIANLTTAVDNLTSSVNVQKATLDSSVSDATAARDAAQTARDTASTHATNAAASASSAATTAAALTGFDLDAIAATIADTAVDVFVYDTSKDSDGGAWRKRTQHTSWYNETLNTATRGSRKEFPAVAVIVAESTQVTIYDGDDPDLPMWMVFNRDTSTPNSTKAWWRNSSSIVASSVGALNGQVYITLNGVSSSSCGLLFLNFPADNAGRYSDTGVAGGEGSAITDTFNNSLISELPAIVDAVSNDVAMTVLPNAPIDAATGLPVPTIAVATDGGVSVIRDDGTVVDSADTVTVRAVAFDENYKLLYGSGSQRLKITSSYDADGFNQDGVNYSGLMGNATGFYNIRESLPISGGNIAMESSSKGLSIHQPLPTNEHSGLFANVTSSHNTGWMNGDIKLATLSDTDDTDVTGSELVTNGTDWTGASGNTPPNGWTKAGNLTQYAITAGGALEVNRNNEGGTNTLQTITTVSGQRYKITFDYVASSVSGGNVLFLARNGDVLASETFTALTTNTLEFVANGSTADIEFRPSSSPTQIIEIDNVSVRLAEEDRSVNGNGLQVFGTVTKNPVSSGADLVAYSGFSSSNYLSQPYNADLDFGTGDFCVMWWSKIANATTAERLITRQIVGGATSFRIQSASSTGDLQIRLDVTSYDTSVSITDNTWKHIVVVRSSGNLYAYINGVAYSLGAATDDVDVGNSPLFVGVDGNGVGASDSAYMALLRISATAPTASQIRKIYEDEKVLFQEGAQATLYGDSDAVTALAYDDSTNLLHVGTSGSGNGRSVFQGLRRVDNTTLGVGVAISASNGLVVEE
jgi:hypothetical protein